MYTPTEYYLEVLAEVRKAYPHADVHAFSSSKNRGEFAELEAQGVSVHLGSPPLGDWAHFATADLSVMARSIFSHVPAMLNKKCVLYQHHWRAPFSDWMTLRELGQALPRCLQGRAWANSDEASHCSSSSTSTSKALALGS
jgi:hypothetical protein